jgi:hypothetical protein
MFFHEALASYLSAVQQITPIFAYMVSIVFFIYTYEKYLAHIHLYASFNKFSIDVGSNLKNFRTQDVNQKNTLEIYSQ